MIRSASRKIRGNKPPRYATARYQSCAVEYIRADSGHAPGRGRRPPHPCLYIPLRPPLPPPLLSPPPIVETAGKKARQRVERRGTDPHPCATGPAGPVLPLDAAPSTPPRATPTTARSNPRRFPSTRLCIVSHCIAAQDATTVALSLSLYIYSSAPKSPSPSPDLSKILKDSFLARRIFRISIRW